MEENNQINKVQIPTFPFESKLADLIISLDHLRSGQIQGTTPVNIFMDLKKLFHLLESVQSTRIEGNRTTILEAIEKKIENEKINNDEGWKEIENIEKALQFIETHVENGKIDRIFISELHRIVVFDLVREGSKNPGNFRIEPVKITNSKHIPPSGTIVESYMNELLDFINEKHGNKYDLIKVAVAHHRFTWIHPFDNGNGRMSRLLTYAMLMKYGFRVQNAKRVLNPTGLFCVDRNKYYDMLQEADLNGNNGLIKWCEYVLGGLVGEIEKIDKLTDYEYLKKEIIYPSITYANKMGTITKEEMFILSLALDKEVLVAGDIKEVFPDYYSVKVSRMIKELRDKNYLKPFPNENSKSYVINFSDNLLLKYLAKELYNKGFILSDTKEDF
ncbi:hypothetical protein A2467_00850 [Candidatus Nomurabacteria bacterium RIFOXYC2_FULL_36_8]|nr:MAG: hypothetical protein UR97_C0009G0023 [Candidatus Nomurabacteria bacterium GW2011_GWE2_36_115]KKP93400.1 MAG: hypothetical protein US00_C0007G0022 [Candidatus Nomurabacteria bacterium GW2011_GWF2_36_126]KKP96520.1 MAG: hypothetical protein US04_C0001G0022 [Candidatus Nomurabacteria bacterium GW2011_GWD2_36_14]KKP99876.1 MAG: hypothetical protein US08_C0001G0559 [Candidatus Nomurabacteria bacterium GW2011_GWF2_36_19]KKQ04999.1 MAG: hypothetical protein US17_C0009G0022 [Candidatus Nomuraba